MQTFSTPSLFCEYGKGEEGKEEDLGSRVEGRGGGAERNAIDFPSCSVQFVISFPNLAK